MLLRQLPLLVLCVVFCLASPAEAELRVKGLRYGMSGEGTRIVFDLDRPADFRAFLMEKPARIAVDLPADKWTLPTRNAARDTLVTAYRAGAIDGGLVRVIFDLARPAAIKSAFLLPKTGTSNDRLVIDIVPVSAQIFSARLDEMVGKKSLGKAQDTLQKPASKPSATPTRAQKKKYTIVIDPGHGGQDPGAASYGVTEKFITLATALELRRQLEETGRYKVVLTRDKDFYIKLHDRVDMSRRAKGDLFISIHADKIDRTGVRGASIYTLSETASDTETARLAEEENNAGFVAGVDLGQESQEVADILLDFAMREKMSESHMLAELLMQGLDRGDILLLPNSHRSAGFAVLKAPDIPSVLIEIGFLSNKNEAKLLNSGQFQRKIAAAMQGGIDAYFRKIEAIHPR